MMMSAKRQLEIFMRFYLGSNPYKDSPPAADGCKVIILDTDHIGGGDECWVWKTFTRGMNPVYMDALDRSDATSEGSRKAMGHTLTCATRMNLAGMTPHNDLASTGYCLASPGKEYLVYLPEGGEGTVNLREAQGTLAVEWIQPTEGTIMSGGTSVGGDKRVFKAPFSGDAVLYIRRQR